MIYMQPFTCKRYETNKIYYYAFVLCHRSGQNLQLKLFSNIFEKISVIYHATKLQVMIYDQYSQVLKVN